MEERPSPNHDARDPATPIDMLIFHYTGMETAEAALARLCDSAAKVSAHYCIDEDGAICRLVAEDRRAWHAGKAFWAGEEDINARSIGIELVNPGHAFGYRDFPEAQIAAAIELAGDIVERHAIPAARVLGHSDVAPLRKADPGERFPWRRLAAAGIGLWTEESAPSQEPVETLLARFGYGYLETDPGAVIAAFQGHWLAHRVTGEGDAETKGRLARLLQLKSPES